MDYGISNEVRAASHFVVECRERIILILILWSVEDNTEHYIYSEKKKFIVTTLVTIILKSIVALT